MQFLAETIERVEYLSSLPHEILIEIIFSMKEKLFEEESIILQANRDTVDAIYFVEKGKLQVSTEFESNKFVLDILEPGSVINHRAIFLNETTQVNFVALTDVKVKTFKLD